MEAYWKAKKNLFTEHIFQRQEKQPKTAVINCQDKKGNELFRLLEDLSLEKRLLSIGSLNGHTIKTKTKQFDLNGTRGTVATPSGDVDFDSGLAGKYNLENIMCAIGAGIALGISPKTIKSGIESFSGVPGRMERIYNRLGKYVFVDYAHTPDALHSVLTTLRSIASGKLVCVFGCGGDRDRTKRPEMGKIAVTVADFTVITSDNPRSEDPMSIIQDILTGLKDEPVQKYTKRDCANGIAQKGYTIEPDRSKAIQLGIQMAEHGDTVLIAGKGHETYQILGTQTIDFDDRKEAAKALGVNDE
jgi:UDP-N-acetylmuramyl-tripeptide synthetase